MIILQLYKIQFLIPPQSIRFLWKAESGSNQSSTEMWHKEQYFFCQYSCSTNPMTEQFFSLLSPGNFAGRFSEIVFAFLSYKNCWWEKVGGVGESVLAPKDALFLKAQGTGTGEKSQELKFKLSKYLIVCVSVWLFTYIHCKILALNCLWEHYRCQLCPRHKWKMGWQVINCTSLSVHVYLNQWPPCFKIIPFQTNETACINCSDLWVVVSELSTTSQRQGNENFHFLIPCYDSSIFFYFRVHLWSLIHIKQ